jgi:hypothetical protein
MRAGNEVGFDSKLFDLVVSVLFFPFYVVWSLLYKFFRWCYKEGLWYSGGLVLIVLVSILLHLFIQSTSNVNFERDIMLYDAFLFVDQGKIPFVDFVSRAPVLLVLNGILLTFFSPIIIPGILYIVFQILNLVLLHKLFALTSLNKKIKFLGYGAFFLLPFGLFFTNSVVYFCTLLTLYTFIRFVRTQSQMNIFFVSLSTIFAIYSYRAFVVLFIIQSVYLFFYVKRIPIKYILGYSLPLVFLMYIPVALIIIFTDVYSHIAITYNVTIIVLLSTLPLFTLFFKNIKPFSYIQVLQKYTLLIGAGLAISSVFIFNYSMIDIKQGVFAHFFRYEPILFFFLGYVLLSQTNRIAKIISYVIAPISIIILMLGLSFNERGPTLALNSWALLFYLFTLIIITIMLIHMKKSRLDIKSDFMKYILVYLIVIFIASNYYNDWLYSYFANYFVVIIILILLVCKDILLSMKRKFLFNSVLLLLFVLVTTTVITEHAQVNHNVEISRKEFNNIINYLDQNLNPGDQVLTTFPYVLLYSGHSQNISLPHPMIHADTRNVDRLTKYFMADDLYNSLQENAINYIIIDRRFSSLFMTGRYDYIKEKIEQSFTVDYQSDEVKIYRLSPN